MFDTILIANRGEIACRIIRTCRKLGIRAVAVYSQADADALHVRLADTAVPIGPAPARDSYLRADRIIEAALQTGAQAIHPGYGFLSERLDLIAACEANGIAFIGPSASAIAAMGDKIRSKQIAREAGVPGVPGYDGADQSPATLKREALRIGLPVMVKASAGGGGKGIRKVEAEADLDAAITAAGREAEAAFGDGRLLIEKFVTRPRHVEVQVAGDRHGNIVHLFERDCSVQRSNQKLLEEAPAPNLKPETRAALHGHALKLSRAIAYDNLGTVEFLVDAVTQDVFFLEMNTRLQVEHPVTEAITGLDLVEWQIRIAAGETLPLGQAEIACTGHAIEARLTAERADEGFRPDTGTIALWREPEGLRVDSGVETGSTVSPFYDSMLAKVIAHGPDREAARRRLADGLARMTVLGPATIRPFLVDALRQPVFAAGEATTLFIAEAWPAGWRPRREEAGARDALAAAIWLSGTGPRAAGPWGALGDFRVLGTAGRPGTSHLALSDAGTSRRLKVESRDCSFRVVAESGETTVALPERSEPTRWPAMLDGRRLTVDAVRDEGGVWLRWGAREGRVEIALAVAAEAAARQAAGSAGDSVRATMPGTIAAIHVKEGDSVAMGQTVAVLESMKLFMDLKSPAAGTVMRVAARPGATAAAGELLIAIAPA
ncbi:acetyl/propionyl/methylcrotonyl-CoA carboxylase subunit alpha [Bosea minatitlanensis]|uniref:Acetyl/propionyl/methylcrotonyl-CoA carboxylase subunit alpha n=1 Tax=Bosea minatitlanensis TaxID=128782 RepID=A0ABW0F6K6_9HYPH|nr:biotin carboxylase N-terminal domain-containing protein [Bosea minatitlanensis]MCT4493125.1 ATP-grasp domain-containing protein [Bosea minatitlanensis]